MNDFLIALLIVLTFGFSVIISCVQFDGLDKRLERIEKEIKDIKNEMEKQNGC